MPLEVAWRLMFRVNDRTAADRCVAKAIDKLGARVDSEPKQYWKQPELWEVSLRSDFNSPPSEGVLSVLTAADALATEWIVSGPTLVNEQVSVFEGVFDLKWGRTHVPGLHWASFSVGEFPVAE